MSSVPTKSILNPRVTRQRPFEEKFLAGGILFEAAVERMKMGILMDQPNATAEEVIAGVRRRLAISRQLGS